MQIAFCNARYVVVRAQHLLQLAAYDFPVAFVRTGARPNAGGSPVKLFQIASTPFLSEQATCFSGDGDR
jgi:hypothetical protein